MGLLDRYVAKEILLPFSAGLLFLSQLLVATQILAQAPILFGSGVSALEVAKVVVSLFPHFLSFVIPVAFLLGAVLGIGRLSDDREVVALGAAGLSPARLVRVPLLLGLAVGAAGLWLALEIEPMSLRTARLGMNAMVKRSVTNDVQAGTFYEQIPGYTLYAERVDDGRWENVLIHDRTNPSAPVLALAEGGRLEPVGAGEEMRLVLERGEVHREEGGSDEYATATFGRAEVVVGLGTALTDRNRAFRSSREMTLADFRSRIAASREQGDAPGTRRLEGYLHRKISAALVVIPFGILAVPLGASRRGGRAFGIGATFVVIVVHYLLLRGSQVLVQGGSLPAALGMQLPNVVLALAGLVMLGVLARRGPGAVR